MQPNLSEETTGVDDAPKTCISCSSPDILPGYPNALCADCRQKLIKFPFPIWIKAFGIGIGIVVLLSCFSFFDNLNIGIHMERGVKAEKEHLYFTAQKEFEQVVQKVPEHLEARVHLVIATFYNQDYARMGELSQSLDGKIIEDVDLADRAQKLLNSSALFFPSDSLNALYEKYKDDTVKLIPAINKYYNENEADVSAGLDIASSAVNKGDYLRADSILHKIIDSDPVNIPAITLLASMKRYQKDTKAALKYIDRLLELNKENLYALSSKARLMIMMNKDKEALKLAQKVDKLDNAFQYNIATLAIVYHYTNKIKQRDEIINKAKASKDSALMEYMQYPLDIISNKETLR